MLFLNFIPEEKIEIFFNAANVVVFAFEEILSSGSVLLAKSFNLPVIAPDKGCLREYGIEFLYKNENELLPMMERAIDEFLLSFENVSKDIY